MTIPRWFAQFMFAAFGAGVFFVILAAVWPDGWWRDAHGTSALATACALAFGVAWAVVDHQCRKITGRQEN